MTLNIILSAVTGAALSALVAVLLSRRKPKRKKKQPDKTALEFSKKIFVGLSALVGGVAVFMCVMVWRTEDTSITQALVDNAFDLLKIGVASYFGKAALENRIKLAGLYPKLRGQIMNEGSGES
jgi:hypothetical protein